MSALLALAQVAAVALAIAVGYAVCRALRRVLS